MDWQNIAPHFERDGFLRDIYAVNSSIEDWQSVWAFLTSDSDRLTFSVDGLLVDAPGAVADVFTARRDHSVLASYVLGSQVLNCHFFDEAEIEFDIDPGAVLGPDDANALASFMVVIGRLVSKPVILTQENDQAVVIARFDPEADDVEWSRISGLSA